jgi:acyl-CoA-binding protein
MSELQERFDAAVAKSKSLPAQSNDSLLKLYALYKQATSGDVSGKKPGRLDLKGRAKYEAWEGRKGTSRDDAMTQYIALVDRLGS